MGVHARDLRPARETADRVGQRPIHEKHCGLRGPNHTQISSYVPIATFAIMAVDVVTEGATDNSTEQVLLGPIINIA